MMLRCCGAIRNVKRSPCTSLTSFKSEPMPRPVIPVPELSPALQRMARSLQIDPDHEEDFLAHVREWGSRLLLALSPETGRLGRTTIGCTKCGLCKGRRNLVLYRGSVPCDILFIGEAPGETEDGLGVPFVGDAGRLLDAMIWQAYPNPEQHTIEHRSGIVGDARGHITYGITNIVACIPRSPVEFGTGEIREPEKEEAEACRPRLLQLINVVNPRRIVALGNIAKRFFPKKFLVDNADLRWDRELHQYPHPSRILHLRDEAPSQAVVLEKRFIINLSKLMENLRETKNF